MIYACKIERELDGATDFILISASDVEVARIVAAAPGERLLSIEPFSENWLCEEFNGCAMIVAE